MKMRFLTLIVLLMQAVLLPAQYAVIGSTDTTFTPIELIEEVCLGEGIEVTDIEYQGVNRAVGRFFGGQSAIGLDQGFMMTTGLAQSSSNLAGADQTSIANASFINNSTAFAEELSTIANDDDIRDVSVFRIRFVPTGDTIMFRYVFASDEYPTFVCSNFNDVFGFFLEGPDAQTGAPMVRNLAQIPGTDLPVSINSVNGGVPGSYPSGSPVYCTEAFNGSLDYAELFNQVPPFELPTYNGYTDVFVAKSAVVPCQEYQMTLVIADVGDAWWDSGIYFEANSFCAFSGGHNESEDLTLTENCAPQDVTIDLSLFTSDEFPLTYTLSGTAEAGTDYNSMPLSGEIDNPADQWVLPLGLVDDEVAEAPETIVLQLKGSACREKTVTLVVNDPIQIEGPDDASACNEDPVTLTATTDSALIANFDFSWSNGATGPSITVNPQQTTAYTLTYGGAGQSCAQSYTVAIAPQETILQATISEGQTYLFGNSLLSANGIYESVFTDANGCDSLVRLTLSVTPQSAAFTDSIAVGQVADFCADTGLFQEVATFSDACGSNTATETALDPATACVAYTGAAPGIDSLCLTACDTTGLCDTTYLIISVFDNLLDAVDDYDTTLYNEPQTVEVLANDWTEATALTNQYIVEQPAYGAAGLNGDGTLTYTPDLNTCLTEDAFSYAICNATGCDTATVYIFLEDTEGQCDLVWPGDVGNDGIVNQMDQWAIGLAYGREGIVRADATIDWVGQYALNWPSTITFAYEFNAKYGDCNGDGLIDETDMEAIEQNWGLTHPLAPLVPFSFPEKHQPKALGAPQATAGQFRIPVYLGEVSQPVIDAYGLSFRLQFEPGTLTELSFETSSGSFATPGSPLLTLTRVEAGHAIVSIVRTDRQGIDLSGHIGDLLVDQPEFTVSEWQILQADGDVFAIPGNIRPAAVSSAAHTPSHGRLTVRTYPVPAQQEIFVELNEAANGKVFNSSGQLIWSGPLRMGLQSLQVDDWQPGLYLLRVEGTGEVSHSRLLINR